MAKARYKDGNAAYMREYAARLKERGLCACCNKPTDRPQFNQCSQCANRQAQRLKDRRLERKATGICTKCPRMIFSRHLCFTCWLGTTAQNTLGQWNRGPELGQLWEDQNGYCAMTGLRLDSTAQLDHIHPLSRGGGNEITNLRWVIGWANSMKHNSTDDEFRERLRLLTSSPYFITNSFSSGR